MNEAAPVPAQRIDKWLWCARFAKTRTLAGRLAASGGVRLTRNGATSRVEKASQSVRPGDVITFMRGERIVEIEIAAIGERRGPASEAATLYVDRSPPPPPREEASLSGPRPSKRDRRKIMELKQSANE